MVSGSSASPHSSFIGSIRSGSFYASETKSFSQQSRQSEFVYRNGSRFLPYSKEEVPHPFSLDKECVELCLMDRQLISRVQGKLCFTTFEGNPPKRILDLGCGLGDWVIDVAGAWRESTFVGFDIAKIQMRLDFLDPSVAKRITWVNGNMLEPLPFEDNSFDFIYLAAVGLSIPEDKWQFVYDEISRVLAPGGTLEQVEFDAIFPVLPKWFTRPLHDAGYRSSRRMSMSTPDRSMEELPHDHALLESLFYSVFESRFINLKPSSILAGYFSASFKHVVSPPILIFPMPPLTPLRPPAYEMRADASSSLTTAISETESDHRLSPVMSMSPSILSHPHPMLEGTCCCPSLGPHGSNDAPPAQTIEASEDPADGPLHPALAEQGETVEIGGAQAYAMYNMRDLGLIDDHTLFVHLYLAVGVVCGAREAMWDELKVLVNRRDDSLTKYGWKPQEYTESESRKKFDRLWNQYRSDMRERLAMWHVLMHHGWSYPRQNPFTRAEAIQQNRLRQAILNARTLAKEEIQPPARLVRVMVGVSSK